MKPVRIDKTCPDCGVVIGELHTLYCDVERCMNCGGQLLSCSCSPLESEAYREKWTGIWPGVLDCRKFGWWSKWDQEKGWVECDENDPEASEDLNKLAVSTKWNNQTHENELL